MFQLQGFRGDAQHLALRGSTELRVALCEIKYLGADGCCLRNCVSIDGVEAHEGPRNDFSG